MARRARHRDLTDALKVRLKICWTHHPSAVGTKSTFDTPENSPKRERFSVVPAIDGSWRPKYISPDAKGVGFEGYPYTRP